jgi:aspartate ammonia-lyase
MITACDEILSGKYHENFIVDAIQGGAGTSFNMNANEVVVNRAIEILGKNKGDYSIVHPNDHANCAQSTNDVFPSAGKIATIRLLQKAIVSLNDFYTALKDKANEFSKVIKMGRTEMQDAVPVSFGQTFSAYAQAIKRDISRFNMAIQELSVLNMGGTAIGTGINAKKDYIEQIVPTLADVTGLSLCQAEDLIDATQNLDCFIFVSGIIKSCAANLSKIANDLRLMSSGPRTGFNEINLPARQAGGAHGHQWPPPAGCRFRAGGAPRPCRRTDHDTLRQSAAGALQLRQKSLPQRWLSEGHPQLYHQKCRQAHFCLHGCPQKRG